MKLENRIRLALVGTFATVGFGLTAGCLAAEAPENWKTSIGIPRANLRYEAKSGAAGAVPGAALADVAAADPGAVADPEGDALQKKIEEIQKRYQPKLDEQTKIIEDKKNDKKGMIELEGKCKWEMTSAKFDIPKTYFKNREFSFDLPKTTFKNRKFSFDYPKCQWKVMNVGFGIKTKFWKCGKERKEWSTKIPEFKWDTTRFSTKIPEFKWDTTEIKFHTLKCKVDEIYIGPPAPEDPKGMERAGKTIESLVALQKQEIDEVLSEDLDTRSEKVAAEIERVRNEFDVALTEMDKSISEISAGGIDPNTIMVDVDGKQVSLVGARSALAAQRDQIVTQMSAEWKKTMDTITANIG